MGFFFSLSKLVLQKNIFSSKIKNNIFPPICAYRAEACILGAPASADKLTAFAVKQSVAINDDIDHH